MSSLVDCDNPTPEQPPLDLRQPCPYIVMPADHPGPASKTKSALRCGSDHFGSLEHLYQRSDIAQPYLDIGINVDPRKPPCGMIPCLDGLMLRGNGYGKDPYRDPEGGGNLSRVIRTPVGNNDHIQLTWVCIGHQLFKQAPDHGRLVVGRDDDSDHDTKYEGSVKSFAPTRVVYGVVDPDVMDKAGVTHVCVM
jgi:hypothetical protein